MCKLSVCIGILQLINCTLYPATCRIELEHFPETSNPPSYLFIYTRYNSNCPLLTSVFPQANPGVVTCLENTLHGLETGDQVTFSEVVGMSAINGTTHTVEGERSALRSSYNIPLIKGMHAVFTVYAVVHLLWGKKQ